MTLYYAIEGVRPFAGVRKEAPSPGGRYPQLTDEPRPFVQRIPDALAATVLDCLRKDPHDRPSPMEVAERLEPIVGGLPTRPHLGRRRPGR